MSKNTIDPAPNPSCFAFLAACLASAIPSSFAPDWRVEASRPLANSRNPNPCTSNALFFPVHVLCVSLGGVVSQYPENENVLRSIGRAASPGYSSRSNPKYTYATRLSAGGVADEWVTQLLRQGDSQVFKKYSQMKLTMKREAQDKLNRLAIEMTVDGARRIPSEEGFDIVLTQS